MCHTCGKKGHIARVCKSKRKEQNSSQPNINTAKEGEDDEVYTMFPLRSKKYDPIYATVSVDGKPIRMEIDTGATLSVISETTYNQVWKDQAPLLSAQDRICKTTHLYGARNSSQGGGGGGGRGVEVEQGMERKKLVLIVTKGQGPSLLGRNWLAELKIDWKNTYRVQGTDPLTAVLEVHKALFHKELGTINGITATLQVDPHVAPEFYKPRPVPFSL